MVKNAARTFAFFVCVLFAFVTLSCGGGGGGGGASGGSGGSAPWGGTKTLSIDINGLMGTSGRATARPDTLDWQKIELTVYVNDEVVYDETIPRGNNDVIRIENVKIGSQARAEAKIYVAGEDSPRAAKSDTIKIETGTNKLTLYVPYNVTYYLNSGDDEPFQAIGAWVDTSIPGQDVTIAYTTTREMVSAAPKVGVTDDYSYYSFVGWNTAPNGTGDAYIPGKTVGDKTAVYAQFAIIGEIVYDTFNYSDFGSDDNPFVIKTDAHLTQLGNLAVNNGMDFDGKKIVLDADVETGSNFMGLSSQTDPFKGTFDGQGHTITLNMSETDGNTDKLGLFPNLSGSVQNLTVTGSVTVKGASVGINVYAGGVLSGGSITGCTNRATISVGDGKNGYAGGIAGYVAGTVLGCANYGQVTTSGKHADPTGNVYAYLGGIAGAVRGNGTVSGCTNYADITIGSDTNNETYLGGIAGAVENGGSNTLNNCTNRGALSSAKKVGGVVCVNYGTVTLCANLATVTSTGMHAGGVAYMNESGSTMTKCYNTATISGTGTSSGAGGIMWKNSGTIDACYNTGNVSGGENKVGGIVGTNSGTITNVYSTAASVQGGSSTLAAHVGGLVGYMESSNFGNAYCTTTDVNGYVNQIGRLFGTIAAGYSPAECYCEGGMSADSRAAGDIAEASSALSSVAPQAWDTANPPKLVGVPDQ